VGEAQGDGPHKVGGVVQVLVPLARRGWVLGWAVPLA